MAGITGGSAYQDYRISKITGRRDIVVYGCCPDPFPTLIYGITFERSNYFYQMKLFVPGISITLVSFLTFWLDPLVGERLSFGIAVILAVTMNDVVATEMMPVCDAVLLMDYVSSICLIFAIVSLIETAIVLNLYHRTDRSWFHALMPVGGYKLYRDIIRCFKTVRNPDRKSCKEIQPVEVPGDRRGLFRLQLYREIFFSLDKNHSGELEMPEVESFAMAVMGNAGETAVLNALDQFDANRNGRLNFDEFVTFCEMNIQDLHDVNNLSKLLRGYVRAIDREEPTIREMWKGRAIMVDTISRVTIPAGYVLSLLVVFLKDEAGLQDIMSNDKRVSQWLLKSCGFYPVLGVTFLYFIYWLYRSWTTDTKVSTLGVLRREDSVNRVPTYNSKSAEQPNDIQGQNDEAAGSDASEGGQDHTPAVTPREPSEASHRAEKVQRTTTSSGMSAKDKLLAADPAGLLNPPTAEDMAKLQADARQEQIEVEQRKRSRENKESGSNQKQPASAPAATEESSSAQNQPEGAPAVAEDKVVLEIQGDDSEGQPVFWSTQNGRSQAKL